MTTASGVAQEAPGFQRIEVDCGVCGSAERRPFNASADVVECQRCGALYVSPRPTDEAIAAFYSRLGHYDHWDRQAGRKAMWQRRAERLRRHVPSGRLLDVGTGQGDFGEAASRHFRFEGTEVSSEGARLARERHGLTVHVGDVLTLPLEPGSYDVITLWHVLEHVQTPSLVVARCRELLRPGGVLAIAVPNTNVSLILTRKMLWSALLVALKKKPDRSIWFPRITLGSTEEEVHLTHFTLRTLSWLLQHEGLDVIEQGIDDHSADASLRARLRHHRARLFHQASGVAAASAIFVAARKPGG